MAKKKDKQQPNEETDPLDAPPSLQGGDRQPGQSAGMADVGAHGVGDVDNPDRSATGEPSRTPGGDEDDDDE